MRGNPTGDATTKVYASHIWQQPDHTWSWLVKVWEPNRAKPDIIERGDGCKTEGIAAMKCAFVILTSEKERGS